MAVSCTISLPPPPLPSLSKPKLCHSYFPPHSHKLSPPLALSTMASLWPTRAFPLQTNQQRKTQIWRVLAAPEEAALPPSDTSAVESTQQIVSATTSDDGTGSIISILLFIAFIALSFLTIGVIYIAVTDFLQKREKDKFEKEEEANKKKKGGKKKARAKARAAPRGFGQKIEDDEIL